MPLLETTGLRREFGGLVAVRDLSFSVRRETVTALIGPNGAGKTTVFNLVSGFIPVTSGRVTFDGLDVTGLPAHVLAGKGIVRTFQNVELALSMSVLENVMLGCHTRTRSGFLRAAFRLPPVSAEERFCREEAMAALSFVGQADRAAVAAGALPFGSQRLVEIARALAAKPRLILMDEPAAGLNNHETEALGELIVRIRDGGSTILLVEHDMDLVMGISEEVIVMESGARIAGGPPKAVQNDPRVIAAYLGEDDGAAEPAAC
jgi:branched-chain amino acid transport system ATP-binding protein